MKKKATAKGYAARTFGDAWWEFETRTAGTILVEVWDLAGNAARQEARSNKKPEQAECPPACPGEMSNRIGDRL